jgi:tetratricopeptide (TPR) repeat protein
MTEQQVAEFNFLYGQGCKKMKGLLITENYRPSRIGFFGKVRANKAIKYFDQALAIYPEHFQSLFFIGKLYQRLRDYEKALTSFESALKFEHSDDNLPQEASIIAMHLNQVDKAIELSEEALRRRPGDFALLGNHSMNLLIAGRDNDAKETIDQAIRINPTDDINKRIKAKIEGVLTGQIERPTFEDSLG